MNTHRLYWFTCLTILLLVVSCAPVQQGEQVEEEAPAQTDEASPALDSVAILIVDDFGSDPKGEITYEDYRLEENCIATPDGQAHSAIRGVMAGLADRPHGEIVLELFREEISQVQNAERTGTDTLNDSSIRIVETWVVGDRKVLLVTVDTLGFTTRVISERIPKAIKVVEDMYGVHNMVINMSFVIVPCDPGWGKSNEDLRSQYENLIAQDPENAELQAVLDGISPDDRDTLAKSPELAALRLKPEFVAENLPIAYGSLQTRFTEQVQIPYQNGTFEQEYKAPWLETQGDLFGSGFIDPLFTLFDGFSASGRTVINVASAGNFGFKFPFAPGIWSSVVSVSATGISFTPNDGDVALKGVFDGWEGTSFSAPRFSLMAARYLLRDGAIPCEGELGRSTVPPLAYAPLYDLWVNWSVADASRLYCEGFLN